MVGDVARDRSTIVPINTIRQILLYAPFDGPESQFCLPAVTLELLTLLVALVEASHLADTLTPTAQAPPADCCIGQLVTVY